MASDVNKLYDCMLSPGRKWIILLKLVEIVTFRDVMSFTVTVHKIKTTSGIFNSCLR